MPMLRQGEYRLRITGACEPVADDPTRCHLSLHLSSMPHPAPPGTAPDRIDVHVHRTSLACAHATTRWAARQLGALDLPAEELVNYSQFVHLSLALPRLAAMLTAAAFRGLRLPPNENPNNASTLATDLDDDGPTCY